jgi:hypothetical protein
MPVLAPDTSMAVASGSEQEGEFRPDFEERKLWLEYLARVNDRNLKSRQASGFTPWALLGVAAAVLYAAVPKIPEFFLTPGGLRTALIILPLESDVVALAALLFGALLTYCFQAESARVVPERDRRDLRVASSLAHWIFETTLTACGAGIAPFAMCATMRGGG